jgi:hypothetical protein
MNDTNSGRLAWENTSVCADRTQQIEKTIAFSTNRIIQCKVRLDAQTRAN